MKIKGWDALAQRFPELRSAKPAALALGCFTLTTFYFLVSDQIPTWTIDSQIVVFALGFLVLRRAFTQRKKLVEKYKEGAYSQAALRYIIPGVSILFAAVAHVAYMDDPAHMRFTQGMFPAAARILGWYWALVGGLLWLRSALTFGVDNLAMLYVYHPEAGGMADDKIYRLLRHPVYGGATRVCWGLALLNGGIFALSFIPFAPLLFFGWVRLTEEPELMKRLPGYAEYRKQVPAFWVKPKDVTAFFRFLITG